MHIALLFLRKQIYLYLPPLKLPRSNAGVCPDYGRDGGTESGGTDRKRERETGRVNKSTSEERGSEMQKRDRQEGERQGK